MDAADNLKLFTKLLRQYGGRNVLWIISLQIILVHSMTSPISQLETLKMHGSGLTENKYLPSFQDWAYVSITIVAVFAIDIVENYTYVLISY